MKTIVGVSDVKISNIAGEELVTYALGSCLGVAVYDPVAMVGGLLHVMLPLSKADPDKARQKPAMYVDTGFSQLLNGCYDFGASKKNMHVVVAGGASMKQAGNGDYFKIGKRNFTVLRKLLWKNGFIIAAQDVGGYNSRTMSLRISDGLVTINKKPFYHHQNTYSSTSGF
ncbi:chemotaxis protein CheD [Natronogracilivirga saccharolytica]|uniref:Probable chemoreceptor glutamine deamidase CheD n=1 Tax=Natronogracilivirga saccharolytica TaxID=2812953 RepID=A0A8J7RQ93_9BACT|nr:chemotaxis protein CheD [Natronogracilivirga saccharolytica]MBP3191924.1 chemotaxis protein CheD [Natronogracilivirga saccharolytica]